MQLSKQLAEQAQVLEAGHSARTVTLVCSLRLRPGTKTPLQTALPLSSAQSTHPQSPVPPKGAPLGGIVTGVKKAAPLQVCIRCGLQVIAKQARRLRVLPKGIDAS